MTLKSFIPSTMALTVGLLTFFFGLDAVLCMLGVLRVLLVLLLPLLRGVSWSASSSSQPSSSSLVISS
jgi:hypothetical protein